MTRPAPPLIEWRDDFRTGVEAIDHEHQSMIEAINVLATRLDEGADLEQIRMNLGRIHELIEAHFALEEMMMRKHHYADYKAHKSDHDRLLDDIRDIMDHAETGGGHGEALRAELKSHISDWFGVHFRTLDRDLHKLTGI